MNTAEKIAVMQGFLDGKPIEVKLRRDPSVGWAELVTKYPNWDWVTLEYRIKPEGKKTRVALCKVAPTGQLYPCLMFEGTRVEEHPYFVRWLTDWIEYDNAD